MTTDAEPGRPGTACARSARAVGPARPGPGAGGTRRDPPPVPVVRRPVRGWPRRIRSGAVRPSPAGRAGRRTAHRGAEVPDQPRPFTVRVVAQPTGLAAGAMPPGGEDRTGVELGRGPLGIGAAPGPDVLQPGPRHEPPVGGRQPVQQGDPLPLPGPLPEEREILPLVRGLDLRQQSAAAVGQGLSGHVHHIEAVRIRLPQPGGDLEELRQGLPHRRRVVPHGGRAPVGRRADGQPGARREEAVLGLAPGAGRGAVRAGAQELPRSGRMRVGAAVASLGVAREPARVVQRPLPRPTKGYGTCPEHGAAPGSSREPAEPPGRAPAASCPGRRTGTGSTARASKTMRLSHRRMRFCAPFAGRRMASSRFPGRNT